MYSTDYDRQKIRSLKDVPVLLKQFGRDIATASSFLTVLKVNGWIMHLLHLLCIAII